MKCACCGQPQAFDALGWLDRRGVRIKPALAYAVRHLFENAPAITSADDWCAAVRIAPGTLRWHMSKKSLPSPRAWVAAARGLDIARALRDDPDRILVQVAFAAGYEDHTGVVHNLRRTFGVTATTIRKGSVTDADLMERWWSKYVPTGTQERNAA